MNEEIKIITLGDIFDNIETEEKAFRFIDYIKDLQQKVEQLENIRKEIKEYIEKNVVCCKNSNMLVEFNVDDLLNILNKGSE